MMQLLELFTHEQTDGKYEGQEGKLKPTPSTLCNCKLQLMNDDNEYKRDIGNPYHNISQ